MFVLILFIIGLVLVVAIIMGHDNETKKNNTFLTPKQQHDKKQLHDKDPLTSLGIPLTTSKKEDGSLEVSKSFPAITVKQKNILKTELKDWDDNLDKATGFIVDVVGNWYRSEAAKEVYHNLMPGAVIRLVPDHNNPHDEYAVKVFHKNYFIGYVPMASSFIVYWKVVLEDVYKCFVVEPYYLTPNGNLQIVIFLNEETEDR